MSEPSTPSPVEAPPPAYEASQYDFDQKLAIATERSLDLSKQRHERDEDKSVENHDGTSLGTSQPDASLKSHSVYSGEQRSTVQPLMFKKKAHNSRNDADTSDQPKERPRWFAEAHLGPSTSNSGASTRPMSVAVGRRELDERSSHNIIAEDSDDEDNSFPPPPFADVDDSLDGPAYERYASTGSRRRRTGNTVVLRYTGEDYAASPPPSPPHSPVADRASSGAHSRQRVASSQFSPGHGIYHHAPQQSNLQVRTPIPRPRSADPHHYGAPPPLPRVNFNPSVAYEETRSPMSGQLPTDAHEPSYNAVALYSSAVAPHLSAQRPRPVAPKVKRYAPSVTSLPEYEQPQQYQNVPSAKPLYAMQDCAASRASVYSQTSVPHIPQTAQYSQTSQYPTQQNYTRPMSAIQSGDNQRWSAVNPQYQSQYYPR